MIWEDVDFRDILFLIPGATMTEDDTPFDVDEDPEYVFDFDSEIDLSRFNVHSSFVRTLKTHGSYTICFPPAFSKRTGPRPLLPNLQHLVINASGSIKAPQHVNWIPEILHAGLLSLEMYSLQAEKSSDHVCGAHAWLDRAACFDLVEHLVHTCSRLETLRLYPAKLQDYNEIQLIEAYKKLAEFTHIRSFTLGGSVVRQELFQALGQLPYLETLSLRADESQSQKRSDDPLSVSDDSFPSLRQLELYHLIPSAIARICQAPQLFRWLISASITYKGKPRRSGTWFTLDFNRSEVAVSCLGANSPRLECLTVLPYGDCSSEFDASWSIIDKFKLMPLKYLRIGRFKDNHDLLEDLQPDRPTWDNLLTAIPQLEALHLEEQYVSLDKLQLIGSRLPRLRLLVFWYTDLRKVAGQLPEVTNATQPIVLRSWSYFGVAVPARPRRRAPCIPGTPTSSLGICDAARFLHGIWSNIICETCMVNHSTTMRRPNMKLGEHLNEAITLLRSGVDPEMECDEWDSLDSKDDKKFGGDGEGNNETGAWETTFLHTRGEWDVDMV
ncbi:hypothetical protein FRC09_019122 [Ceratobasidium sp. 395]|nr:hypothetical protein FRC09_019122 [Ceratobasidium sp. 395]